MESAALRVLATALALVALSGCSLTWHREAPVPAPAPPPVVPAAPPDLTAIPDAVPRAEPRSAHGNPPFYDVFGPVSYTHLTLPTKA